MNYLGEWHTHPEDVPSPSSHDRRDWLRTLDTAQFEQSFLFFIIVGRTSIGVWEGQTAVPGREAIEALQLLDDQGGGPQ